eukprot:4189399-Prymnesium_polylepis.1
MDCTDLARGARQRNVVPLHLCDRSRIRHRSRERAARPSADGPHVGARLEQIGDGELAGRARAAAKEQRARRHVAIHRGEVERAVALRIPSLEQVDARRRLEDQLDLLEGLPARKHHPYPGAQDLACEHDVGEADGGMEERVGADVGPRLEDGGAIVWLDGAREVGWLRLLQQMQVGCMALEPRGELDLVRQRGADQGGDRLAHFWFRVVGHVVDRGADDAFAHLHLGNFLPLELAVQPPHDARRRLGPHRHELDTLHELDCADAHVDECVKRTLHLRRLEHRWCVVVQQPDDRGQD